MQRNKSQDGGSVNLVVAHPWEARPLIEQFKLKLQSSHGFRVYGGDGGVCLIVSGMGKLASAAAVAYLAAIQENSLQRSSAWLNVGIAGHKTKAVGSLLLAGKIYEATTDQCVYPALQLAELPVGGTIGEMVTVDAPELNYPENKVYEMEAFGFYTSANKFVTSELIQVAKVISDNPGKPVDNINAESVTKWISGQRFALGELVIRLQALSAEYNAVYSLPGEFERLRSSVSFSTTQEAQLRRLYRRYYALGLSDLTTKLMVNPALTSRQILRKLDSLVMAAEN